MESALVQENFEQEEQPAAVLEEEDPEMPDLVAQVPAEAESDDEGEDEEVEEEEVLPPRRSTRIAGGVLRPSRYTMTSTKVRCSGEQSEPRNGAIKQAEIVEIEPLFADLRALQPVQPEEMGEFEPLRSHSFLWKN